MMTISWIQQGIIGELGVPAGNINMEKLLCSQEAEKHLLCTGGFHSSILIEITWFCALVGILKIMFWHVLVWQILIVVSEWSDRRENRETRVIIHFILVQNWRQEDNGLHCQDRDNVGAWRFAQYILYSLWKPGVSIWKVVVLKDGNFNTSKSLTSCIR